MKKFLSIILLISICSTFCVPTTIVFASKIIAGGGSDNNFQWKLDDEGVLTISGIGDIKDFQLGTAPWYSKYKDDILTVVIENGVSSISSGAFYDCKNLYDVSIPNSVTYIGGNAFMACESLESVEIPDSVTEIKGGIFRGCKNLSNISLPSEITRIAGETFYKCVNLSNVEIPSSVTEIGKHAFYGCEKLNNITLSKNVTRINSNAFAQCNSLFNINYEGNESDWENISIDYGNTILENAEIKCLWDDETPTTNICFICGEEIDTDDVVYDENNQPLCQQCSDDLYREEQYIKLKCPHCSEILEITEDEYNECENIICPDCMKFIIYRGEDTEYECFNCGETVYYSKTKVVENGKIYCPYCNEIVDDDNLGTETECYICCEYFNADDMLYDEEDNLICQECYDELQNEDEELTYIECPYCEEMFEDSEDIYDEDGYAVCPYCDGLIDTSEEIDEENEIEFITSDWAAEEVYEAYQNNLIPDEMLEDTLYDIITREEFAAIAVKLYENIVGEAPYVYIDDMPFTDCDYESEYISYIAIAYELGITKGTSQTTFSPYDNISREQLATMLYRVIKLAENDKIYDFDVNNVRKFYDDSEISDYAKESVYYMAECGIVKGVDGAHFAPLDTATKEQSILISVRCVNSIFEY